MNDSSLIQRLVRLEGLIVGLTATIAFDYWQGSWLWFALLILTPDLGMVGYLVNPTIGSYTYNLTHAYLGPILLLLLLLVQGEPPQFWLLMTCMWLAHIGFDRCLGFGLKYPTSFRDTHLQKL